MAKYRGNSDDWLDHEGGKNAPLNPARKKPEKNDRAKPLELEKANATVAEIFPNQCRVKLDEDHAEILCSYRRATVFQQSEVLERSPVAVGDRVLAQRLNPQSGVVEGVCLRRNHLSRPAPGKEARGKDLNRVQHVIAANIDLMVIVTSTAEPAFSEGMVDRYLVAASHAGIHPLICLNKIDLLKTGLNKPTDLYRDLGYQVFDVSSKKGLGLDPLKNAITDKAVVFCGQSGVGKTSLLRNLLESEIGKVGGISTATGKGKHTTTAAILLGGPPGSSIETQWIDTPGVREFGLSELLPEKLAMHFPEFKELACPQEGCFHEDEEGCLARALPRYDSYRRILTSLRSGEN